jgi:hypothetical protein
MEVTMLEGMRIFHVDTHDSLAHKGACDTAVLKYRKRVYARMPMEKNTT